MKVKTSFERYSILLGFIAFFLAASFLVRTTLIFISHSHVTLNLYEVFHIYIQGFIFDVGVAIFISTLYVFYLLLLPQKWNASKINKYLSYVGFFIVTMLVIFTFFAEFAFWLEFESRFNFISVDYLIYTYEVFNNIRESYPLPLVIGGVILTSACILLLTKKLSAFTISFRSKTNFISRLLVTIICLLAATGYGMFIKNDWAEQTANRYNNELAKAGIYSFFAAYKNNEINFAHFYSLIDEKSALSLTRKGLMEVGVSFKNADASIRRNISNGATMVRPNVIMITVESFSAEFMKAFGNNQNLTPFLDSLAAKNILFTSMFATGSRTIRGMEALSLSVPPTPGSSIVRRPDNDHLFTIGTVFKNAGYTRTFIYGGDGYFDNMNEYFGTNGFDIIDHGRGLKAGDDFKTKHTTISANNIHFENAWGISDEDLYDAALSDADEKSRAGKPFYYFVMTTSNHRPYTYPPNKIDIPSGSGREGAVQYTDYAIRQFFNNIKNRSWYNNTIIIIVADHCANSAGKNEIDISKYHIPCIIVNPTNTEGKRIDKMCSQIDLYPTLFKMIGWDYESNFFGRNVLADNYEERIVLGTYQKLAYLKQDSLVILGPQQISNTFLYDKKNNWQVAVTFPRPIIQDAIAQYQTAYFLFKNGKLKE